jgi:hypothetical protein
MSASSLNWSELNVNGEIFPKNSKASIRCEWIGAGWVIDTKLQIHVDSAHKLPSDHQWSRYDNHQDAGWAGCDIHVLLLAWLRSWCVMHHLQDLSEQSNRLGKQWQWVFTLIHFLVFQLQLCNSKDMAWRHRHQVGQHWSIWGPNQLTCLLFLSTLHLSNIVSPSLSLMSYYIHFSFL